MRLENVLTWKVDGRKLMIDMEYIGGVLSVNHYKYQGRFTKPSVRQWMDELALVISQIARDKKFKPPVTIKVDGFFADQRATPDLHNLHKVIGDAVEQGLGINDRDFRFQDGEVEIGANKPWLRITLK